MRLYELVFIVRQDLTSAEVDRVIDCVIQIVKDNQGNVTKQEYWGLRPLAYHIANNKKGHYVMLGLEISSEAIDELHRKIKLTLSSNVIRYTFIKVSGFSEEPSPILNVYKEDGKVLDIAT